jgi:effector-binding domain-containing protein
MVNKHDLAMIGFPFTLYHDMTVNGIRFESCFPVIGSEKTSTVINTTKPAKCLVANHYGNLNGLRDAHKNLQQWMLANGKKWTFPIKEVYRFDIRTNTDTANWLTRIYYPLK